MLSPLRRLLKVFHPEASQWPGTMAYNAITRTDIFQRHYELVASDIVARCPEGSLLDVGTGPGWLLAQIHRLSPGLQLTGLDASPSMVAKAKKNMAGTRLDQSIELVEGNVSSMPFADESFDTLVSTGSVHHWKDPVAGLNEIYRVLRPGGCALIYDLVSDTPASILKDTAREFGRFRMVLLWIHAFEEPFYTCKDFELLPRPTLFKEGQTRFVGVLCCLALKREDDSL
jgi:ubiquinone/menaquinone biosynthesis C-methylase UbiE